jgi:hypothetical protein
MRHNNPNTTGRYVKEAEDVGSGVGAPFPVLPACLLSSPSESDAECTTNEAKKLQFCRGLTLDFAHKSAKYAKY